MTSVLAISFVFTGCFSSGGVGSSGSGGSGGSSSGGAVVIGPPTKLVLVGSAAPAKTVCTAYTIVAKDDNDNTASVNSDILVNLAGGGSGFFYSALDSGCAGSAVTSATIASGSSSAAVYFKDGTVESLMMTATDQSASLSAGALTVSVQNAAATQLFLSGAATPSKGTCTVYTVTAQDSTNTTAKVPFTTTVNLSGNGAGRFYAASDSSCSGSAVTSVTINSGSSATNFYFKDSTAQSLSFGAADNASLLTSATSLSVDVQPGAAYKLVLSGTANITNDTCTAYTVTTKDSDDNTTNASSLVTVTLAGAGAGAFYATGDSTCSGATVTSTTVALGSSSRTFYFKDSTAESLSFTATDQSGSLIASSALSASVAAGSATKLLLTGSASPANGSCTPYVVSAQDAHDNTATVSSTVTVDLSGNGNGAFYAATDSNCIGSTVTSTTIASGSSSRTFYFKDSSAETLSLGAADHGNSLASASSLGVTVQAGAATKLVLSGSASPANATCTAYTVTAKDSNNNTANVGSTVTVNLSGNGNGFFYASGDSTCTGSAVTNTTITSGASSNTFYFKDAIAESLSLGATDNAASLAAATALSVSVQAGSPAKLALSGAAAPARNSCTPYTVTSKDANNNVVNVSSTITVNLSGNGSGNFYGAGDSSCAGSTVTTTTIASGASSRIFYFKDSTSESLSFGAADNGATLTSATALSVSVQSSSASKLILSGSATPASATCTAYTITAADSSDVAATVSSNITVNLSGAGSGSFYATGDSTCAGSTVTTTTIASGTSSRTFYFKDATAQSLTLGASDNANNLTAATGLSITVQAGAASKLVLSGSAMPNASACTAYTVSSKDANDNLATVGTIVTVNLSGGGAGAFYAAGDSSCSGSTITSTTIANGASSRTFYFKNATAESLTLGAADNASNLTSATGLAVTVQALSATKLVLSGSTTPANATCTAYTITSKDTNDNSSNVASNITVNLSGQGSGAFYSSNDPTCSGSAVTSTLITSSSSSITVYFKDATAEVVVLAAADNANNLTSTTLGAVVQSGAASKLVLSGSATPANATCTAYTVTSKDANNNAATVNSTVTVNLSGAGAGFFYASGDSTCAGSTVTSTTIASGASSRTFYFKDATSESLTLGAADNANSLTAASGLSVTVAAGTASKLALSGSANPTNGACTAYTVTAKDSSDNAVNVSATITVNLSGNGHGAFYATGDSNCSGSTVTSTTIANGASSRTFYFKDTSAESLSFGAADNAGNLTSATALSVTVPSSGPSKLALSGSATPANDTCTAYTVTSKDTDNNSANVSSNVTVNLSGNGTGSFYAAGDSTCSGSTVTTTTIASGASAGTFYFKDAIAESLTLGAADNASSLASASGLNITVAAGTATKLVLTGSATPANATCTAYTVTSKDANNNTSTVSSTVTVNLSGNGSGSFYAAGDSTCAGSTVTTTTIANGASSRTFYFKDYTAESLNIGAADNAGSLTAATALNIAVAAGSASKLALSGSAAPTVATCTPYTVTVKDVSNNTTTASSNTTINLSGAGSGAFYAAGNSSCSGSAVITTSIGSGSSSVTFYFKDSSAESLSFGAADNAAALTSATALSVATQAGTAAKLVLSGSAAPASATCTAYTVTAKDTNDNASNVGSNITVNLSGNGSGAFYAGSDSSCTGSSVTSTSIASGSNTGTFYFKDTAAETLSFGASDPSNTLTSASTLNVSVQASAPTGCTYGTASPTYAANSAISANSLTCTGGSAVTSCSSNATLPTGLSLSTSCQITGTPTSAQTATTYTITATNAAGSTTANISIAISGAATKLSFSVQPSNTTAGSSISPAVVVKVLDANSTLVSSATDSITLAIGTNAGSGTLSGTVTANATSGVATFSNLSINKSGTGYTLSATATGLTSATSSTFNITAGSPTKLVFLSSSPTTAAVDTCTSSAFTIESEDTNGNASSTGSAVTVSLSGNNTGTVQYYTDSACTGSTVTQVTIASNQTQATFYVKDYTAETFTITASAGGGSGLTDATRSLAVSASAHRYWELYITASSGGTTVSISELKLYWSGAWHSLTGKTITQSGGTTAAYPLSKINDGTAETSNAASLWSSSTLNVGVIVDLGSAQVVEGVAMAPQGDAGSAVYSTPTAFTVYSGDSNTGPWTSVKSYSSVSTGLANWNPGTFRNFLWPAATAIAISGSNPIVSVCSPLTITLTDSGGTPATASTAVSINLTGGASGAFYSASSCSAGSAITSLSNVTTTSTFYFLDASMDTTTIYGTDAASVLTQGSLSTIVSAGHRYVQLSVTGGSSGAAVAISELKLYWGGAWRSLTGKTITQTAGATNGGYPLSNINDGTTETSNAANIWYSSTTATLVIDLGSDQYVTGVQLAPQGTVNSVAYNTPTAFTISTGDSSTGPWTTVYTGSSISINYPNWNPGTFRSFSW